MLEKFCIVYNFRHNSIELFIIYFFRKTCSIPYQISEPQAAATIQIAALVQEAAAAAAIPILLDEPAASPILLDEAASPPTAPTAITPPAVPAPTVPPPNKDDDLIIIEEPVECIVINDEEEDSSIREFRLTRDMLKLIETVKKYPEIYNPRMPEFKDYKHKSSRWNLIANEVNDKATKLMKCWILLMTRYEWEINKRIQCKGDGNTPIPKLSRLETEMEFLRSHIFYK